METFSISCDAWSSHGWPYETFEILRPERWEFLQGRCSSEFTWLKLEFGTLVYQEEHQILTDCKVWLWVSVWDCLHPLSGELRISRTHTDNYIQPRQLDCYSTEWLWQASMFRPDGTALHASPQVIRILYPEVRLCINVTSLHLYIVESSGRELGFNCHSGSHWLRFRSGPVQVLFGSRSGHVRFLFECFSRPVRVLYGCCSGSGRVLFGIWLGPVRVLVRSCSGLFKFRLDLVQIIKVLSLVPSHIHTTIR
jgi:hypothetical protein